MDGSGLVLADGTALRIRLNTVNCTTSQGSLNNVCGGIGIDVNGMSKGSNQWGNDVYGVLITSNGILPAGAPDSGDGYTNTCQSTSTSTFWGSGIGCSAQYLLIN